MLFREPRLEIFQGNAYTVISTLGVLIGRDILSYLEFLQGVKIVDGDESGNSFTFVRDDEALSFLGSSFKNLRKIFA